MATVLGHPARPVAAVTTEDLLEQLRTGIADLTSSEAWVDASLTGAVAGAIRNALIHQKGNRRPHHGVGELCRTHRIVFRLAVTELPVQVGLHRTYISMLERGQ
jgi:hypothetical protein